jgi:hypothetical protein
LPPSSPIPGGQNRFATLARPQPLGNAVDEQIDDGVFGEDTLAQVSSSANSRSVISLTAARDWSGLSVTLVNRKPGRGANDRSVDAPPRPGAWEETITTEQKVIRAKVGLSELARTCSMSAT